MESFDIFKIENNEKKEYFSGYYISTSNNETKDIDIYKIYSKDNIKKIYSLEVKYSDIFIHLNIFMIHIIMPII